MNRELQASCFSGLQSLNNHIRVLNRLIDSFGTTHRTILQLRELGRQADSVADHLELLVRTNPQAEVPRAIISEALLDDEQDPFGAAFRMGEAMGRDGALAGVSGHGYSSDYEDEQ